MKKWLLATLGGLVFALAVDLFYLPAGITTGGITGLGMIALRLFGTPVGLVSLLLNVPLFLLGFWKLGARFGIASLYATAVSYLATDAFAPLSRSAAAQLVGQDVLLACLAGGLTMGAGLGMVFAAGATTGGVDIAASLVRRRWPRFGMGGLMLAGDLAVLVLAAAVQRDARGLIYGGVALFLCSRAIDAVLVGADRGTAALIVTDRPDTVKGELYADLSRGVTELSAVGGYTGRQRSVLLCAVLRAQTAALTAAVRRADPEAFVILTEAREMVGRGFGHEKEARTTVRASKR